MAGLLTEAAEGIVLDAVAQELRRWAREPFAWGETDCGLSLLDYAQRQTGRRIDPQPRYAGERGAMLFLKRRGGFAVYADWAMAALGLRRTATPARGDVGLVERPEGLTACLCLESGHWAAHGDRMAVIFAATALHAWRLPCRRP